MPVSGARGLKLCWKRLVNGKDLYSGRDLFVLCLLCDMPEL